MSTIITYQCDRCHKKSVDSKLIGAELKVSTSGHLPSYLRSAYLRMDLCEECAIAVGAVTVKPKEDQPMQMTEADKLYDIIYDMVGEIQSNQ